MNLLRTILIISAATAANGFAPSAGVSTSTRLNISTGEGGQGKEDAAMYYAPKKVPKKASEAVNNQLKRNVSWGLNKTGASAPKTGKAAPAAKKEAPKKKGFSFGKLLSK